MENREMKKTNEKMKDERKWKSFNEFNILNNSEKDKKEVALGEGQVSDKENKKWPRNVTEIVSVSSKIYSNLNNTNYINLFDIWYNGAATVYGIVSEQPVKSYLFQETSGCNSQLRRSFSFSKIDIIVNPPSFKIIKLPSKSFGFTFFNNLRNESYLYNHKSYKQKGGKNGKKS